MSTPPSSELVNLARIIDDHDGGANALIHRSRATTYDELRADVAGVRGGLAAAGVGQGDRVALVCGNDPAFVVTYLAVLGLGAVAVPLNPGSPAPELEAQLGVVEPVAVLVGPRARQAWSHVADSVRSSVRFVIDAAVTDDVVDGGVRLADLTASEPHEVVDVEPEHLAVLAFTSGTAGSPKAAMLSHGNLLASLEQSRATATGLVAGDVVYGVLPLFHVYGFGVLIGATLLAGATLLLVRKFDPDTAATSIRDRGVTVVPGAPPMWVAFAEFDELPADAFAGVRLGLSGASRLPRRVAERIQERFGLTLHEGYGLTEAAPVVTTSLGHPVVFGSVGFAIEGVEIRLVSPDGTDVPVGDAGEIWVRGANVFSGYLDDPEATAHALTDDGWLKTGDLGTVDDEGRLYLVDRAKDLIIVSGFNVFPAEVEQVLMSHPSVEDAAVVGVAHPHTGEAVKAFVVAVPGRDIDEDELFEYAAEHLARYKCPRKILEVSELPRNVSGKLVRRQLDHELLADV